jgi:hypothetical protein
MYGKEEEAAEIPNIMYENGRYNNYNAYNKVMQDDNVRELYELLI